MSDFALVPTVAQSREWAEDVEILPVPHFIEANTQEVNIHHLDRDCVTPVFAKDNELTINHPQFIRTVAQAAQDVFSDDVVLTPEIRVSHVVKGRVPEAVHKPASQLLESDKTIYYERCAFSIDIPTIKENVSGNPVTLSIVGVRAYNQMNLFTKKSPELFKLAIGFKNMVCCNMCIFSDGMKSDIRVSSVEELYKQAFFLFLNFEAEKQIRMMKTLQNTSMSECQFAQIIGKMRLYQFLPMMEQRQLPRMSLTDSQINQVAKAYYFDDNFKRSGSELDLWRFYNLLTGANKSSYIDSFLERSLNATEMAVGISAALNGDPKYKWFIA